MSDLPSLLPLQVNLLSCKFMGPAGYGSTSDAVQCIDFCLALKAHIISASWTTGTLPNPPLEEAGGRRQPQGAPRGQRTAPGVFQHAHDLNACLHPGMVLHSDHSLMIPQILAPPLPTVARTAEAGALLVLAAGNFGANMKQVGRCCGSVD